MKYNTVYNNSEYLMKYSTGYNTNELYLMKYSITIER